MAALSPKLRSVSHGTAGRGISFWCPGCNKPHQIRTEGKPPTWSWDGNVDAPTFSPSILVTIRWSQSIEPGDDPAEWRDEICHSFVRGGVIEFLSDCTHSLAGQRIALPDWPAPEPDNSL